MRVLLVDDEKEFVCALAERLSIRGIDADAATDGAAALEMAKNITYELAILDVKMPKIDGIMLQRKLHSLYPDMKFIFMTGHGSEQDFKAGASKTGTGYYLVKPVHIEDLLKKMNEIFNQGRNPA